MNKGPVSCFKSREKILGHAGNNLLLDIFQRVIAIKAINLKGIS